MSQVIPLDHLQEYFSQIHSMILSLFANHSSMKCIQSSTGEFQYLACPIRLMEQLDYLHPIHGLVMQTLETFHQKYDGCSSKTLLFVLTTLYMQMQMFGEECLKIVDYLEQLIDESKIFAENHLIERYSFDPQIFYRICRGQTIYSDALYQAYAHSSMNITSMTRVKSSQEKCSFIPGLILPINPSISGYRRTVLIDGYLHEDYTHRGYNNKMKLRQISSKTSWMIVLLNILKVYSIEVIICSGTVDNRLKQSCIFLENIPMKTLRLLGEDSIIHYLTDVTNEHILSLDYIQPSADPSLTIVEKGSTIVQDVPVETLVDVREEQLSHCLARIQRIVKKKFYLNGSGDFEKSLYRYWYEKKKKTSEDWSMEKHLACEIFLQCLERFHEELIHRFEGNFIDDFDSKFDAWKISIDLLRILFQIDDVVQIIDENISHTECLF